MSVTKIALGKGTYFGSRQGSSRLASAASITTSQTLTYDVDVSDFDTLTLLCSMTGAANGDLAVTVSPWTTDETTPTISALTLTPATTASGPAYDGSANVNYLAVFDLRGIKKARISVKNNNAGTKSINYLDVFTGVGGADIN